MAQAPWGPLPPPLPPFTGLARRQDEHTDLWSLVKERVPDLEEHVADNAVHKHHQEPVEGDEGVINFVLLKVGVQPGQLLAHQVSEHPLVHLWGRVKGGGGWGFPVTARGQ